MMIPTGRRRITASLLCWFLPTSGLFDLLVENSKITRGDCAKNSLHRCKVEILAPRRQSALEIFNRISDPTHPQIPIDCYPA